MSGGARQATIMHAQNSTISAPLVKPSASSLLPPAGTVVLCLLTVGVSVAQTIAADSGQWSQPIGVIPASLFRLSSITGVAEGQAIPVWLTLFVYIFLHGGWSHVLPNMAGLWVFGAIAEPVMGTR